MFCSTTDVVQSAHAAPADLQEEARKYELPLLHTTEDLIHSVRSSVVSAASVTDLKRDHHSAFVAAQGPSMSAAAASAQAGAPSASQRRRRSRVEQKIKLIAQFLKTLSAGLTHKRRTAHASGASASGSRHNTPRHPRKQHDKPVPRKTQVSLSQYNQPYSAPDVLDHNASKATTTTSSGPRYSCSSQHTPLSWEEICAGAVMVDENEVMPASPRSRKRGRRSREMFEMCELRRVCAQCDVPAQHMDTVVHMLLSHFGTCQLDLTVLHELVGGNSVVLIGMLVFSCIDYGEELLDLRLLPTFLQQIQTRYNENNPFHNACHAADVLHSLFMMLWTTPLGDKIALHNQIGVLFAAIMHDIEHIGLTNDFLLKTNHEIALKYSAPAPMEEMHAALAIEMLTDVKFHVLAKMTNEQQEEVLSIVRHTIRSTALCYQKEMLADIAAVPGHEWDEESSDVLPLKLQTLALRIAMHVSDISQTMKPFEIHAKWVDRLNEELFLQGDLDERMSYAVCPDSYFRHKWSREAFLASQVWFLENIAMPAAKSFNSIPWLHVRVLEENMQSNIHEWKSELKMYERKA